MVDFTLAGLVAVYCSEIEKQFPSLTSGTRCLICIALALAVRLVARVGFDL